MNSMYFGKSHWQCVTFNRRAFEDDVPTDYRPYVYTYYDEDFRPIYTGFTTDAVQRASTHRKKAPWAPWVYSVRYRPFRSASVARKAEQRIQRMIPSYCSVQTNHGPRECTFHGEDWSPLDYAPDECLYGNHVSGSCRLPGGWCSSQIRERSRICSWSVHYIHGEPR